MYRIDAYVYQIRAGVNLMGDYDIDSDDNEQMWDGINERFRKAAIPVHVFDIHQEFDYVDIILEVQLDTHNYPDLTDIQEVCEDVVNETYKKYMEVSDG